MARTRTHLNAEARKRSGTALLVTLFLHTAFLYGFKARPHGRPQPLHETQPDCVFLSAPGAGAEWEGEIRAWCKLADPTLLSLPNESLGFSRVRRQERVLPYSDVPPYEYSSAFTPERPLPELALAEDPRPLADEISGTWESFPAPVPPDPVATALPEGIIWRLPDGTVLDGMPALPEDDVRVAMAEKMPTAPTRIEVCRDARRLRVRVRRPSGSPQLDLLLLRVVTQAVGRLDRQEARGEPAEGVLYPSGTGDIRTAEVEWRLLPVKQGAAGQ